LTQEYEAGKKAPLVKYPESAGPFPFGDWVAQKEA
jgi:hypothetical protein